MIGLAQHRNLPHANHDDLLCLAMTLDEEHGPEGSTLCGLRRPERCTTTSSCAS